MAAIRPFRALRPMPGAARRVAAVPYDVVTTDEARELAAGEPLSFLRVSRAEIDLPPGTDPHAETVYARAADNLRSLRRAAPLVTEADASLYCYRLHADGHEQVGLAACYSLDEYDRGAIKKHEHTRPEKEDDRTRHMLALRAQAGLVFLTYRATSTIDDAVERACAGDPLFDFEAPDGVRHTVWAVPPSEVRALVTGFEAVPALYIADGHHRAASAARARTTITRGSGAIQEADSFVAVAFPHRQVRILPYHRVVRDLHGQTAEAFLDRIRAASQVETGGPVPTRAGEVSIYLDGAWHRVVLFDPADVSGDRAARLDVARLHRAILEPLLGIGDVRQDPRIDFVGGARGTAALEDRVDHGEAAVAFSMFPVTVDDLMGIADEGGIMPPKSTWFEPKLRDGLLIHPIG
ncbi:MAG: DUF1015 family protein [Vicinamibacterales bacterium]|nr:DUF1015 family protein [Vicinamibacterales bacterium]MDP6607721.1 DUF1015 family protein [Vicinamibacterales bacterium]HAK55802.1 DUF1015 domain-containing protein [Acidobacteriota bacterium]